MSIWTIFGIGFCIAAIMCFALAFHFNALHTAEKKADAYKGEMYRLRVEHEGWRHVDGLPLPMPPRERMGDALEAIAEGTR
jgi:hypothetical protein